MAAVYGAYAAGFALIVGTLAVAAAFTYAALAIRLRALLTGAAVWGRRRGGPPADRTVDPGPRGW